MNITRHDADDLVTNITITIEPADYGQKFNQKLNSFAQKANIKGFRKGKVPANVIKKMYGHSIFAELLDELFNTTFSTYIKENNIKYIAQPILSENQEQLLIDYTKEKSYTLTYTLGLLPDFEVNGASESDSFAYKTLEVTEEDVNNERELLSRRLGKLEFVEDIDGSELIYTDVVELENGVVKEGGFTKAIVLFAQSIEDKSFKDMLKTKKLNDSFEVEVSKLENQDLEYIKKNVLNLPAEYDLKADDIFRYTINKISRLIPAELTDELVKEKLGLENMEELEVEIKKSLRDGSTPASDSLLKKSIMDSLMENTDVKISETFAKLWLRTQEKLEEEKVNEELPRFVKELKWTYIKDAISTKENIQVSNEDIKRIAAERIKSYEYQYGKLPEKTIKELVQNWYSDKNELYTLTEEARTNKVFKHLFDVVKKEEQILNKEEFEELFNQ